MNLQKLFKAQAVLDAHINEQHPVQDGEDRLAQKILALQVELGELANEWCGFKFWSTKREARTVEQIECSLCYGTGDENYEMVQEAAEGNGRHEYIECSECNGTGYDGERNPLLEEYVDCLHFILSIGIEMELDDRYNSLIREENIVEEGEPTLYLFAEILSFLSDLFWNHYHEWETQEGVYKSVFTNFIELGKSLGFAWDEVEKAYFTKNQTNHARQDGGY